MNIRRYLRDRRLPAAIVGLALAAGAAQTLLWWMGPAPKRSSFVGPPRSGYTLSDARVTKYDDTGKAAFHMVAPHVERREGDESLYINAPRFNLPSNQPGVPDWNGQSLYGWVDSAGTVLKLQGPVHMHRDAYADTPATDLESADITAWPNDNRMQTDARARMVQGGTRITGLGMRANLNDKHLELLDDVHATFPPRTR